MGYDPKLISDEAIGIAEVVLSVIASKKLDLPDLTAEQLQGYLESSVVREDAITIPGSEKLEADSPYSFIQYLLHSGLQQNGKALRAQIHIGPKLIPFEDYQQEMRDVGIGFFGKVKEDKA